MKDTEKDGKFGLSIDVSVDLEEAKSSDEPWKLDKYEGMDEFMEMPGRKSTTFCTVFSSLRNLKDHECGWIDSKMVETQRQKEDE